MKKLIVITGYGTVNPLGNNSTEFLKGLQDGKNGIVRETFSNASGSKEVEYSVGRVKLTNEQMIETIGERKIERSLGRCGLMSMLAVGEALKMSKLSEYGFQNPNNNIPVIFGIGGIQNERDIEVTQRVMGDKGRASPFDVVGLLADTIPGKISLTYGFHGPNQTTTTACASSLSSIRCGVEKILLGDTDIAIVGGGDAALNYRDLEAFNAARALSKSGISRPFDKDRDGFVMGEGSTMFVIETLESALARGVKPLAYISGYGATSDAFHQTAPDPNATYYIRALEQAIRMSQIKPEKIDVFNAHGTSTPLNDAQEARAYNELLENNPYVIGIKALMGHLLGGAGGTEALASVLSMQYGFLPEVINTKNVGPWGEEDTNNYSSLNISRGGKIKTQIHLTSNAGFAGHNEALCLIKY